MYKIKLVCYTEKKKNNSIIRILFEKTEHRRETAAWKRKIASGRKSNGKNCLLLKNGSIL